jgi:sensor histidine kinase YesM
VVGFAYLMYLTYLNVREHIRMKGKLEGFIPIACSVFIIMAVAADLIWSGTKNLSFLTVTMVTCCVFYYIWLHLQFVRAHERALMAEQRIRIMISQIQPHFLYNTLSTIQALCLTDPEKAADITQQFGVYLRQNIDSLDQEDLITFDKEMEHTRIYAEIEQVRFPSIKINYEILDSSFNVPALTLQPMVENAIRHGVRIRKEGIINIRTYYEDHCHIIEIEDNGKGFVPDLDSPIKEDESGRSHIGLRNVKERIETLCGGTFEVNSVVDVGTKITMRIPEKEED